MHYLYRFDVVGVDNIVTTPDVGSLNLGAVPGGVTVFAMTNRELLTPRPGGSNTAPLDWLPAAYDEWEGYESPLPYEPTAIEHSELRYDAEKGAGEITVSLPLEHPLAQLYALDSPAVETWLTLKQVSTSNVELRWVGQIVSASFDATRCTFTLHHLLQVLKRPGLTAKHPRACGWLVYDTATCRVKSEALDVGGYWKFREDGFLSSVSEDGLTVVVPQAANKAAGWFAHGFLLVGANYTRANYEDLDHVPRTEFAARGIEPDGRVYAGFRRSVVTHSGSTLTLVTPLPPGIAAGSRVTLYAGCDGALATCKAKFSNVPNHGGYPYIPIKNPAQVGLRVAAGA